MSTVSLRPVLFLAAAAGSLALLGSTAATGRAAPSRSQTGTAPALNHWVFRTEGVDRSALHSLARELVAHVNEAHPEVHLEGYRTSDLEGARELHFFLETVNARAQSAFITGGPKDEECRRLLKAEEELVTMDRESYLRLIAADPEKERLLGRGHRVVVWTLQTHFPKLGAAIDCAEQIARHVNANYPSMHVRAYDEWFPRSGRIHLYFHQTGTVEWEGAEAEMRRDPVIRRLFDDASDAFVEGDFEDVWLADLSR